MRYRSSIDRFSHGTKGERRVAFLDAVDGLQKLLKAAPNDLNYAYAAVAGDYYREEWIKARGVKQSRAHSCIRRLLGLRCDGYSRYPSGPPCRPPMADHVSFWNKDGKPYVYVSQPYPASASEVQGLLEFCGKWGLSVDIGTWPAWHYPGAVLMVEIRKKDTHESRPVGPPEYAHSPQA